MLRGVPRVSEGLGFLGFEFGISRFNRRNGILAVARVSILSWGLGLVLGVPAAVAGSGRDIQLSVSAGYLSHVGTAGTSFTGSKGYGLSLLSARGGTKGKFVSSGNFWYAPGAIEVGGAEEAATIYGGDFQIGFQVEPLAPALINPIFIATGGVGGAICTFGNAEASATTHTSSLYYVGNLSFGAEISFKGTRAMLILVTYQYKKALSLADVSGFGLDSITASLGIVFF